MIESRQELNEYLKADLAQAYVPNNVIKRWLYTIHGNEHCNAYKYVRLLRYTEYYLNTNRIILYHICRLKLSRLGLKLNIRIGLNMAGKGLYIMHLAGGGGCIVNCHSMGDNCCLQSGVVIGNVGDQDHRPIIGNNVVFGLGCKVYGKIKIGDNVTILPNSVVTHDIPSNSIVGGIPAKPIKSKGL